MAHRRRLLVIGAGPVGLEAALHALPLGYEVRVLEAGRVGENVVSWGHVPMFSPWEMNCSSQGLGILARQGVRPFADGRAAPTGREYVARYLLPLRSCPPLLGIVQERTRVVAVSRDATLKQDRPGDRARALRPFRVLAESGVRQEIHEAEVVLDVSGTYGRARELGNGGIPAPGEKEAATCIDRGVPDLEVPRVAARFAGRTILLVGAGHSAATSAVALAALASRHPRTRILWSFRSTRVPLYPRVPEDPLTRRDALCAGANRLAQGSDPRIEPCSGSFVESIARPSSSARARLEVILKTGRRLRRERVDRIATCGPIKLAAALLGEDGGDCLSQVQPSADRLSNPEPGFYILGAKSYGRNSTFLIRAGLEQIRTVFAALAGDPRLDLDVARLGHRPKRAGAAAPAVRPPGGDRVPAARG
ncbi:MAG: hypothetical protein AUG03_06070 [Acidobacteria bacterium 13_1_20CM_2_68_14]|nr:MAG: hypothetical protein AUG03_06070 [Acidobacteria bacterium 13_1_20CM_2_68_14]